MKYVHLTPPESVDPSLGRKESAADRASNITFDDIVITRELAERPKRRPNYRIEAEALRDLAQVMANSPETILQKLAEWALLIGRAQSAGISLLEEQNGQLVFRWCATAGAFAPLLGQTLPRDFSPCGAVLDTNAVQLLSRPVRFYPYISTLPQPVEEVLLVPFRHNGTPIGTVWLAAHDAQTHFDAEDARIVGSLSQFAAAAAAQTLARHSEAEANQSPSSAQSNETSPGRNALAVARERAKLSDARFHAFFDQAPFYACLLSTEGRVSEVGRMALETSGYLREEVLGKLFWETAWWCGSSTVQLRIRTAFETVLEGEGSKTILPFFSADGTERWVDLGLSPVFAGDGTVGFVIATGMDVTERRKTESDLAAVQRRFDAALIAGEIGTYEWDILSDRLYGDRNFVRLFGVPIDADGGAPLESFLAAIHPEDRDRVSRSVQYSVATGENYEEDYRVVLPSGERWINVRGHMTKNASGKVVSFLGVIIDITERKQAEHEREAIADQLRRLMAIHETVLSATNDFAYVFDLTGRFLYANRPLLELYGRPLEEVVGKTFSQLGYPDWHAEMHLREVAEVIATQRPIRGEVPFTGESGKSGVYDYIFTPVFGANGEVEAVAGTTRDVSDRKRGENRDRLLIALDDATRPLTHAEAITQAAARLVGEHLQASRCAYADVEEDENTFNLTGDYNRDVPSIVGRYRFDQFSEDCLRAMRAGEAFVCYDTEIDPRTAMTRESYRATKIRSVICVPLQKSGRLVAAMAVHQSTTRHWLQSDIEILKLVANQCWESIERTRVIRVLAESEQRLRLAVETGRLGVWELDLPTRALHASSRSKAIYGRTPDGVFSYEDMLDAVHPEDREKVEAAMNRSIANGTEFDLEYRTSWPDGRHHWILVRGQTRHSSDGKPQRMIGVSLDINARKEAESEQIRLREEAVRASRAKDDFLATLSHELRTPLNPVLLLASDAAQDDGLPADTRGVFATIRKNIEIEARLIDDLLDLTAIARGKLVIKKDVRDIHPILTDAVTAVQAEFDEKNITVDVRLGAARHLVFGDEVRLVQVFINLLKNAAKFTPINGTVNVHTASDGDGVVVIRLSDTGIGMTPEELNRVFSAFEQGDHASVPGANRFGGLGLGLAIAQRLVELHDGTLIGASEGRDAGTTFTIRLPLYDPAKAPKTAKPPLRTRTLESLPQGGARILLVEDHEPTRKTLDQLLSRRNYTVVSATSISEARERANAATFDLVVSDLGLPDGDGTTLMAELRDHFGLRGIALTGYGMIEDVARCRAAGFVVHLTKPIRVEALESALREFSETFRS